MTELLPRLEARGWRITPQRRAIAQALAGEHVHLTADDVYERARRIVPEVSVATVYNTLHELARMGEVVEVNVGGAATLYDPNATNAHHHLLCRSCGELRDVAVDDENRLRLRDHHAYDIHGIRIVFEGRCPRCRHDRSARGA